MAIASQITLGTMRLSNARSVSSWADFFSEAHDLGIRSIHVSHEYETWPLFCQIASMLKRSDPGKSFAYVVKIAEPHFDQEYFVRDRLEASIDIYREALELDKIDDVQWMWRGNLNDEPKRQSEYYRFAPIIEDSVAMIKDRGKILRFLCFPYSLSFAEIVLGDSYIDGLVVYRNRSEREYDAALDFCAERDKMAHIIRPFFGGAAIENSAIGASGELANALDHSSIETAILSTSRIEHLRALVS